MNIMKNSINFTNIRKIVDAADNLQQAGRDDDCKKIMRDLSRSIERELEETE